MSSIESFVRALRALEEQDRELQRIRFHLQQIADGAARDPQIQAKVALRRLPVDALLAPAHDLEPLRGSSS